MTETSFKQQLQKSNKNLSVEWGAPPVRAKYISSLSLFLPMNVSQNRSSLVYYQPSLRKLFPNVSIDHEDTMLDSGITT